MFLGNDSIVLTVSIFVAIVMLGIALGGLMVRNALRPLYQRYRVEWAKRKGLPPPSALLGPIDVIKAEAGKIIVVLLIWSSIGIWKLIDWLY
jgi:hypothetical protein